VKFCTALQLTFHLFLGVGAEQREVGIFPVVRLGFHETCTRQRFAVVFE